MFARAYSLKSFKLFLIDGRLMDVALYNNMQQVFFVQLKENERQVIAF